MGQSLTRLLFYPVDWTLNTLQARFNPDPNRVFLEGNYAPVSKEWFQCNLDVQGNLPDDLQGEFVRNGPNPKHIPKGNVSVFVHGEEVV
mgnify:CR=1 FL=1